MWNRVKDFLLKSNLGRVTVAVAVVAVGLLGWLGWWLASPLIMNETVDEAFPLSAQAVVPTGMTRDEVEEIMMQAADEVVEIDEVMPQIQVPTIPDPTAEPEPTEGPATPSNPQAIEPTATPISSTPEPEPTEDPAASPIPQAVEPTATPVPPTLEPEPTATPVPEPVTQGIVALKEGQFRDADSFHRGSGSATIYELPDGSRLLRLEDFSVTNGPRLHVYLSNHPDPMSSTQTRGGGYTDLGGLKGNRGNQNYEIPEHVDISEANSVVIYCVPFRVVFSVAPLG